MQRLLLVVTLALVPAVAHADKTKKTAEKSAKKNAKTTRDDAKANGRATREAAHEKE